MKNELLQIEMGGDHFEVELKRHPRATRLKLRVTQVGGVVTVTAPSHIKRSMITNFIEQNEAWIRTESSKATAVIAVKSGAKISYLGGEYAVYFDKNMRRGIEISDNLITVGGDEGLIGSRIERQFRGLARERALMTMAYSADRVEISVKFKMSRRVRRGIE